jgi:hypothetical protein
MKIRILILAVLSLIVVTTSLHAQGTAFTYQGRLNTNSAPYSGSAEFQFTLWDAAAAGSAVATNNPASLVATVTDGLFTVTLDFGLNPFNGQPRFLQTDVRTAIGPFTTLNPRQPVTATPYALRALNLTTNGLAGTYGSAVTFDNTANSFAGAFTGAVNGNGSGLTNVNAITLGGLSSSNFWKLGGNAGANPANGNFLGTTDNQPLELRASGIRALRLEAGTNGGPNVIGGSPRNYVAPGVFGATIGGGGVTNFFGSSSTNIIENGGNFGTIAGGEQNMIRGAADATIGGGAFNTIDSQSNDSVETIGGGAQNHIGTAGASTISGGFANQILDGAAYATVGGGVGNVIQTNAGASTISGGFANQILDGAAYATVGGGVGNVIQTNAGDSTISGGAFNTISTNARNSTIGGGSANTSGGTSATISGGTNNVIESDAESVTIGGGSGNLIRANDDFSTIGGGFFNQASNSFSATIAGGYANAVLFGSDATISGGTGNKISASRGTIGGGIANSVETGARHSTISGGAGNSASGQYATIPGGQDNRTGGDYAFAAGHRAKANHIGTFTWADSTDADFISTSSNQFLIRATGGVGIGTASPSRELEVQHAGDVEIGLKSTDTGGHLWTIQSSALTGSTSLDASFQIIDRTLGSSRLFIGTNGFVGIGTTSPTNKLHVVGGVSATVFVTTSDRNAKENFAPVSSRDILEKVIALPLTQWSFKELPGTTHIGPMAQDFYAAFKVGAGSTGIATVDADGVALAAIQGLNQKLEEQRVENAELKQRLEALEKFIHNQKSN